MVKCVLPKDMLRVRFPLAALRGIMALMQELTNDRDKESNDVYRRDNLRRYIQDSELRVVSDVLRVRLSTELAEKYDAGVYTDSIKHFQQKTDQITKLGLQYPGKAEPIFYVYLVPDDNFVDLLGYPDKKMKGGGKPVNCYDLDGFATAYGLSQNMWANFIGSNPSISREVNDIHEFGHLVHSQFFNKERYLGEGFAEVLPLYTMGYEANFSEHSEVIRKLDLDNILSVKQLLELERSGHFDEKIIIPGRSCSFRTSYISSYLFVRGCIEIIGDKFGFDKVASTQKFLEIVRCSRCNNEWLVFDLADILEVPEEDLLSGKTLQANVLRRI